MGAADKLPRKENGVPPLFVSLSPFSTAPLHTKLPKVSEQIVETIHNAGEMLGAERGPGGVLHAPDSYVS